MFHDQKSAACVPTPFDMGPFDENPCAKLRLGPEEGAPPDSWPKTFEQKNLYLSSRQICNVCTPTLTWPILCFFLGFAIKLGISFLRALLESYVGVVTGVHKAF